MRALLYDLREGFGYLRATPWLHATLAYASLLVLLIMGPFEVLVPFAIKDRAGGGPAEHAMVLAAFGIGGALGSLVVSSLPLPRRYLSAMNLMWGLGCLPIIVLGLTRSLPLMVAAALVTGFTFNGATVIWGTLLQRRVPSELLGRVSSLDFFISLAFMPLSMALAGPVSTAIGLNTTFVLAGSLPLVVAVVAILAAVAAVLVVVPRDAALEVEAFVLNRDIGFVGSGQQAAVKVDTFEFTRYGLLPARVRSVSVEAVEHPQFGAVYPARVALERDWIAVGEGRATLAPGMAVQVEIRTGTRKIIDYFLSPLGRVVHDSIRER